MLALLAGCGVPEGPEVDLSVPPPTYFGGAAMLQIPTGTTAMGCRTADVECGPDQRPQHRVALDAFEIGQTEVTVSQYSRCVAAGHCAEPRLQSGCDYPQGSDHPMNCVSWPEAAAYCAWLGARLPTEAEWEMAARGDTDRIYPWGNAPPSCDRAVMGFCAGGTQPVGSKPAGASPFGALDMCGNVWEWVADWYAPDYYAWSPRDDPRGPRSGTERVRRGGGWANAFLPPLRISYRAHAKPEERNIYVGFRCAR